MPPEYAVYGSFSVKSDVFSFGVIVLEIVSGRKSREFFNPEHNLNLIGHVSIPKWFPIIYIWLLFIGYVHLSP